MLLTLPSRQRLVDFTLHFPRSSLRCAVCVCLCAGSVGTGTVQDKLRLLMIYYLCNDVSDAELKEFQAALVTPAATDLSIYVIDRFLTRPLPRAGL